MDRWETLTSALYQCNRCPLCQSRHMPVAGKGNRNASIMLIAEAPGHQEDQQGIPFVGPAGRVLDILLASANLTRQDVYLTNLVKCHPPGNRDPKPEEQQACLPYLRYETALLKPPVIVCLGRIAAQQLIDPSFKITKQHGTWVYRKGYWITALYHPAAILRDPAKLEETKKDFQRIIQKLQEIENSKYPF